MKIAALIMACAILVLAVFAFAAGDMDYATYGSTKLPLGIPVAELQWGEPVAGLEMAAITEPTAGVIHCWIRNAESREITYNNYTLGEWEYVGIEVRDSHGAWTPLEAVSSSGSP